MLVGRQLFAAGAGNVEDLAAQGQDRLVGAVARLFGGATGRIAFDDEKLSAGSGILGAVGELAGQTELSNGGLAADFLFLAAAKTFLGPFYDPIEQLFGLGRIVRQVVVEGVAQRVFDDTLCFGARQPVTTMSIGPIFRAKSWLDSSLSSS